MVRNQFTKAMVKDMYAWFFEKYDLEPLKHEKFLGHKDSTAAYEQSTSAVGLGELDEVAEMEEIPADNLAEGYTTYGKNRKFAKRIEMSQELIEDHQKVKDLMKTASGGWGSAVNRTLERFYAKFFNYGGYTAGHSVFNHTIPGILTDPQGALSYDGTCFFDKTGGTKHASKGGDTYFNAHALSLTSANFETVWNQMTISCAFNERDEEIAIEPNVLIVPNSLKFTAQRILESEKKPGSMDNDTNVLQDIVELVTWRYLATATSWILGVKGKGLIAQKRRGPKIDFYYDEDAEIYKAKISMRYGCMDQNFRYWASSNLPTSA